MSDVIEPEEGESAPAALFEHCVTTYRRMLSEASAIIVQGEDKEEQTMIVWEGFLTKLITGELHLSVPYYTSIVKCLRDMGCIVQLKRGGGTAPSRWALVTEPTIEAFGPAHGKQARPNGKYAALQQQIQTMSKRLTALELALQAFLETAEPLVEDIAEAEAEMGDTDV